jgi:type IV pilus assembly protein PilN
MAHINLLPWREERNKQKQREFAFIAGGSVVTAGLIVLFSHIHFDGKIVNQNQRNDYLQNEISVLDKRIGRIKELESLKADLLARMNVIQELQSSRPESVHLMDELVRTVPEGVYLNTFAQKTRSLEWLTDPRLGLIKTTETNRRRIANFILDGTQKIQKNTEQESSTGGAG